ncbi:UNVERIFIED_CONTAM: hypothetical protein HDU68_010571 [Siphonaria sp. JEL0065]|nr:hypothetical protein HDU68_010571 [Siphonaria sp. JEL0065]
MYPIRSAILLFCIGTLVMMGVIYLHIPSSPIPVVVGRTKLSFPFRLENEAAAHDDDDTASFVALFVREGRTQIVWVAKAVVQVYEASVAELVQVVASGPSRSSPSLSSSSPSSPSSSSDSSPNSVAARFLGAERIFGRRHITAIQKATRPLPALAFLSYAVDASGESYAFSIKVIDLFSNGAPNELQNHDSASPESPPCINHANNDAESVPCGCINFADLGDRRESCIHDTSAPFHTTTYKLPGNMWINRFSYTFKKSLLYWRYLDEQMFRLVPTVDSRISENIESSPINAGPQFSTAGLKSGFKSLALVELYSEDGVQTVLDFRYKDMGNDDFWFKVFLNYRNANEIKWNQHLLINDYESRRQLSDVPIQYDDYYFTVNPVVALSRNGTCALFLWKGTIHVLDYVGSQKLANGESHGFTMMRSRLVKSLQSNIRMRGAVVDDDGLTVALVTDTDSVITLRRNFTVQERPEQPPIDPVYQVLAPGLAAKETSSKEIQSSTTEPSDSKSGPNSDSTPPAENPSLAFFTAPWDIGFLFDTQPAISNIQALQSLHNPSPPPPLPPKSATAILPTLERGSWRLETLWSPDFMNEASVETASIVSLAFLPPDALPQLPTTNDDTAADASQQTLKQPKLLMLLWSNDIVLTLNLDETYGGSFIWRFIREKWSMFLGMGIVVGLFITNELRWSARDAFLRANFVMPFGAAGGGRVRAAATAVRVVRTTTTTTTTQQQQQPAGQTPVGEGAGVVPNGSQTQTTTTVIQEAGTTTPAIERVETNRTEVVDGMIVTTSTVQERSTRRTSSSSTTTTTVVE